MYVLEYKYCIGYNTVLVGNVISEKVYGCNIKFYDNYNIHYHSTTASRATTMKFNGIDIGTSETNIFKHIFGAGFCENIFDNEVCTAMLDFFVENFLDASFELFKSP